jgi:hypothetical protein
VHVVLRKHIERDHQVIDVVKDQRMFVRVLLLLGEESNGVFAPVAEGVEVVRSVIAIVVAVAVALP